MNSWGKRFGLEALLIVVVGMFIGTLIGRALAWKPQERVLMQAWGWVSSCTAGMPAQLKNPNGSLDNVRWKTFAPGALDDALPGHIIGLTVHTPGEPVDTIYIDEAHQDTVWVLAHELLHHVLADSTVWGSSHPFVPFAFPCHLFEWQQDGIGILGQHGPRPPRVRIP